MRNKRFWAGLVLVAVLGMFVWQPWAGADDVFGVVTDVLRVVQMQYWRGVDANTLIKGALKGIMEALNDPYAQYLPPQNYDGFVQQATGAYAGIGIAIETTPNGLLLTRVFRRSPAAEAGLKAGDIILFVNGTDVRHLALADISALIRGEVGSTVSVSYYRGTLDTLKNVMVTRAVVRAPSAEWKVLDGNIGYIKIAIFGESLKDDIEEALVDLAGTRGLILDMRGCPGGLLSSVTDVAPYFVKRGPLMLEVSRGGQRASVYSPGPGPDKPLVVLVNNATASAAEILLGGIQDSQSGVVIGTRTFGKGVAQSVYNLGKELGGYKFTVVGYLTPLGREIDGLGLDPDIRVEDVGPEYLPPLAELISPYTTLKFGMTSAEVRKLQAALKLLGYFEGSTTNYFGSVTRRALTKFQQSEGLEATGVATFEVIEKINAKLIRAP
ncbi:MAG: S41 family peptidase, partial [Bacillota bacterium]|nr:S41 family peptidase [Bacillota bacterium]